MTSREKYKEIIELMKDMRPSEYSNSLGTDLFNLLGDYDALKTREHLKPIITTIERINFSGKWAEIWTGEGLKTSGHPSIKQEDCWDRCCKAYMLHEVPGYNELASHITNNGWKGIRIVWEHSTANWEPYALLPPKELEDAEAQ